MRRIGSDIALDVGVDLLGAGKNGFQSGDPQIGREPTQVPADWLNTVQEELMGILESVGMAQSLTDKTQVVQALRKLLQSQAYTSFTTTGASPAYVGAFTPAVTALTANLRAQVTFHAANSGVASTLNVNGLGAKNIKQYNSAGALVDAFLTLNQKADLVYDGTAWIVLDPLGFSRVEADGRYVRLPTIARAFTPGTVISDMPSSGTNYVVQTLSFTGATNIRVQGHAAFANSSTSSSVGVALQMFLNGSNQFGGHYLGGSVPLASANNQTQIPISITDRKITGLDPLQTYVITLIVTKNAAVGPTPVLDAYLDVEYS